MAFTLEERQVLGIHGLLPPRFKTQEEQLELCRVSVERYEDPLNKYIYLMGLQVNTRTHLYSRVNMLLCLIKYFIELSCLYLLLFYIVVICCKPRTKDYLCHYFDFIGPQREVVLSLPNRKCGHPDANRLHTHSWVSLSEVRHDLPTATRLVYHYP